MWIVYNCEEVTHWISIKSRHDKEGYVWSGNFIIDFHIDKQCAIMWKECQMSFENILDPILSLIFPWDTCTVIGIFIM